ncbi:hypothetical protein HDR58_01135 [bacterium]|nr:hypothetical protein [bacterium]
MSFSTISVNQNNVVNNLSKYVIGAEINKQGESSGIAPGVALMGGISAGSWVIQNRKDLKGGWEQLKKGAEVRKNIVTSTKPYTSNTSFSTLRNTWTGAGEYISKGELESIAKNLAKKGTDPSLQSYITQALKNGKDFTKTLKDVEQLQAITKLTNYNAKVANEIATGSKLRAVKDAVGITKIAQGTKELAVKSSGFRSLLKGVKGNAGFAAISFGIGVVTDVIPAFQLGKDKGFKQLGKTAAKTGFEVAGWWAGSVLGAKAGAAIGTCIGGPIGTAVGGVIGFLGGFLGSFVASKIGDAIVGPNEVEKAQKESAENLSQNAMSDSNTLNELAQVAYMQLAENAQKGQLTENDMIAKESLEKLIGREIDLNELAKTNTAQTDNNTTQQDTIQNQSEQMQQLLALQQQLELQEQENTKQKEKTEQENIAKSQQRTQTNVNQYTPYQGTDTTQYGYSPYYNNPFLTSAGNNMFQANNQFTFNPYGTNTYSNDMYYQNLFGNSLNYNT